MRSSQPAYDATNFAVFLSDCCAKQDENAILSKLRRYSERAAKSTSQYAFEVPSSSIFSTLKKRKIYHNFSLAPKNFKLCVQELPGTLSVLFYANEMFFNVRTALHTARTVRLIKLPLIIRFFQDKHIRNGKAAQNEDERSLGASVVMR